MPFILLTNDDGIEAPGLPAFADALSELGDVEVVVPDQERSWIGKAITRFEPVRVNRIELGGRTMHTASGYPADCVQLGVHTLFDRTPDIVVSGINVGYNHGSAYLQSSGTVGAALEGAISGIRSIAYSMGSNTDDWDGWKRWAESPDSAEAWERLAVVAVDMTATFLDTAGSGAVSVGLPDSADRTTERRLTTVAQVGYSRLFSQIGPDLYTHTFGALVDGQTDMTGTDIGAAIDGVIAITPVEGAGFSETSRSLAEALLQT